MPISKRYAQRRLHCVSRVKLVPGFRFEGTACCRALWTRFMYSSCFCRAERLLSDDLG